MAGSLKLGFLVCPPESLLDGFVHRPGDLDSDIVRAVSSHLARCTPCREEADRRRRDLDAARERRPWIWSLLAILALATFSGAVLWREPARPAAQTALRFSISFTGRDSGLRPDPRIAALARFEPPGAAATAGLEHPPIVSVSGGGAVVNAPPLSPEDHRELAAARARLEAGAYADAARLFEDLALRHPALGGLRLLLAYAYARGGDYEKAQWQYAIADELGAGLDACLGLANASLKVGDLATARRELADHVLTRRSDDESARDLLDRIKASRSLPR